MAVTPISYAKSVTSGVSNQTLFNLNPGTQSSLVTQTIPQTIKNSAVKIAPSLERQFSNSVIKRGMAPVAAETAEKAFGINIIKGLSKFTKPIPFIGVLVDVGFEAIFPAPISLEPDMRSGKKPTLKPLPNNIKNPEMGETGGYTKLNPVTKKNPTNTSAVKNRIDLKEALKIFNKGVSPIYVGKNETIKEISKRTGISAKNLFEEWKKGGTVQEALDRVLQNRINSKFVQAIKGASPAEVAKFYNELTHNQKINLPKAIKDAIDYQIRQLAAAKQAKEIYKSDKYEVSAKFNQLSEDQKNALNPQVMQAYYDKITRGLTSFTNHPYPTRWWVR